MEQRTIEATPAGDRKEGLTLAELAGFYNDCHDAGAPADCHVSAEVTFGGKVRKITARWDVDGALAQAFDGVLAGAGAR